jgi:hypothetical protein
MSMSEAARPIALNPHEGDHRAVRAAAGVDVEERHALDLLDGRRDAPDHRLIASLREVRHALDDPHGPPP